MWLLRHRTKDRFEQSKFGLDLIHIHVLSPIGNIFSITSSILTARLLHERIVGLEAKADEELSLSLEIERERDQIAE